MKDDFLLFYITVQILAHVLIGIVILWTKIEGKL